MSTGEGPPRPGGHTAPRVLPIYLSLISPGIEAACLYSYLRLLPVPQVLVPLQQVLTPVPASPPPFPRPRQPLPPHRVGRHSFIERGGALTHLSLSAFLMSLGRTDSLT